MNTKFGIQLLVKGDYALFTRPEMKSERVSYDVMTPSAARGILAGIYWKPAIEWVITGIRVLKPIQFFHIKRNEVDKLAITASKTEMASKEAIPKKALYIEENRQLRSSLVLKDVAYVIDAYIKVIDTKESDGSVLSCPEAKHIDTFKRRASSGKCFYQPYFGCREFPVDFQLIDSENDWKSQDQLCVRDNDFGYMLHDLAYYSDKKGAIQIVGKKGNYSAKPQFFRASMVDGYISVPPFSESQP